MLHAAVTRPRSHLQGPVRPSSATHKARRATSWTGWPASRQQCKHSDSDRRQRQRAVHALHLDTNDNTTGLLVLSDSRITARRAHRLRFARRQLGVKAQIHHARPDCERRVRQSMSSPLLSLLHPLLHPHLPSTCLKLLLPPRSRTWYSATSAVAVSRRLSLSPTTGQESMSTTTCTSSTGYCLKHYTHKASEWGSGHAQSPTRPSSPCATYATRLPRTHSLLSNALYLSIQPRNSRTLSLKSDGESE